MPAKPAASAKGKAPAKTAAPLSKAEIKAKLKDITNEDSVNELALVNLGREIGTADVVHKNLTEEERSFSQKVNEDLVNSVQSVNEITSKHHKAQSEFRTQIEALKAKISALENQVKEAEATLADLKAQKKKVLFEKDSVIENQKREMKEMAYQFSDMLMKTLITITEDFEAQTVDLGHDDTGGMPGRERLKEFNLDRIRV